MAITFYCPCGQKLQVPEEMGGRPGKCPTCAAELTVPNPSGEVTPRSPASPSPPSPTPLPTPDPVATPDPSPMSAPLPNPDSGSDHKACPACGGQILTAARKCKHCGEFLTDTLRQERAGRPPAPTDAESPAATEGLAIASLVTGILSLPLCLCLGSSLLLGPLSLVLGIMARKKIQENQTAGDGMAIAGIILGSIGTLLGLGFWVLQILAVSLNSHSTPGMIPYGY